MAPDTSFDRLHFSVQQVFAEIRIVWQLVQVMGTVKKGKHRHGGILLCAAVDLHGVRSSLV